MLSSLLLVAFLGGTSQSPAMAPPPAASSGQFQTAATSPIPPPPSPALRPVTPEVRADILMARKMYREAVEKYEEMPETAGRDNKIGIAYHQMLQFSLAKRFYERAVKLEPRYGEAINNIGTVYYGEKSYGRAIKQYKRALRYSPDAASIFSNLGTAYFARHKYKEAFAAYQRAMELDPDVFEHRNAFGVLLQERSVDDLAKFHFYMAKVYAKSGMNDRALLYIRKALEEGFKDRQRLLADPEFSGLQNLPEFQQLLALQPRIL